MSINLREKCPINGKTLENKIEKVFALVDVMNKNYAKLKSILKFPDKPKTLPDTVLKKIQDTLDEVDLINLSSMYDLVVLKEVVKYVL